jgi:hypothetical protein
MTTTYELYKDRDDDTLVTMLLISDDQESSLEEAEAEDEERAERLRTLITEARNDAAQYSGGGHGTADTEEEQSEAEVEAAADQGALLITLDGQVLHGIYEFTVRVLGWLQIEQHGQFLAYTADPMDLPLNTYGTIEVDAGVPGAPLVTPPPPPEDEDEYEEAEQESEPIDPAEIQQTNICILNAMFVDGAGASQRSARVLTEGGIWVLKNVHDTSEDARLSSGRGVGTIMFTRNRMTPNEILITDEGGLDVSLVKREIKDLLERGQVDYPYRDRKRVNIHD